MIGYITLGTNDLNKSAKFYDGLLDFGYKATRQMESDRYVAWGTNENPSQFCITKPFNNGLATVSNGGMISFMLESKQNVIDFYNKAIALGASDEGKPGLREGEKFYGSYFRDLDGNKICAFHIVQD